MITPSKILYVRIHKEEGKEKIELKASVATREFDKGEWANFKITSSQHNGQRSAMIDIAGVQVGQVYLNPNPADNTEPFYHAQLKYPFYTVGTATLFRSALEQVFGEKIDQQQLIIDNTNFVKHSPLATMSGIPAESVNVEVPRRNEPPLFGLGYKKKGAAFSRSIPTRMNYEVTVHDELGLCINSVAGEADEFIQPIWLNFDLTEERVIATHPLFECICFQVSGRAEFRDPSIRLVDNFNSLLPKNTRGRQFWKTTLLGTQLTVLIDQAYEKLKKELVSRHATADKYLLSNSQAFGSSLVGAGLGGEAVYFESNDEGTVWSAYLGQSHLADIKEGEVGLVIDVILGESHLTLRAQIEQLFRSMDLKFA